jgi:hypothetical protein
MQDNQFPNGFTSWIETHHEVVAYITRQLELNDYMTEGTKVRKAYESQGTGGLYELAEDWTSAFESENKDKDWDGDFFDEIEVFLDQKNNQ